MGLSFGPIDSYLLFGGGLTLAKIACDLHRRERQVTVVTSERLRNVPVDGSQTFEAGLAAHEVPVVVSADVHQDERVLERITSTTLGVSLGAPWIFQNPLIERFDGKLINGHHASLPRDRGGGGFSWRIMRRERTGACVLHQVTPGIDDGPIIASRRYQFPPTCNVPEDFAAYASGEMYQLLQEVFQGIERQAVFEVTPQQEAQSTYWPRLSTDCHGYVDWSWTCEEIAAFIDAFDRPYPGASTFWNGQRVRLKDAQAGGSADGGFHPFQSGLVYRKTSEGLWVAARGGALLIGEVADETGLDLIPSIRLGDRLYTPRQYLEAAQQTRLAYTPSGVTRQTTRRHRWD